MSKRISESDESVWDTDGEDFFQSTPAFNNLPSNNQYLRRTTQDTSGWITDVQEYDKSISRLSSIPRQSKLQSYERKKSAIRNESSRTSQEQMSVPTNTKAHYTAGKLRSPLVKSRRATLEDQTDTEAASEERKKKDDTLRQKHSAALRYNDVPSEDHLDHFPQKTGKTGMSSSVEVLECSTDHDEKNAENSSAKQCGHEGRSWSIFSELPNSYGEVTGSKKKFGSFSNSHIAKNKSKGKKQQDFEFVRMEQVILHHKGAVRTMKFSVDGRYLASGGEDAIVRVWSVVGSFQTFANCGDLQNPKTKMKNLRNHPKPPLGSIISPCPYREYSGHKAEVTDLDWSVEKNFILSASSDMTVMLWNPSKTNCLRLFRHADYISSVRFHPTNSSYFVSASYDTKIRIWNIVDHRVVAWEKLETLVTAAAFSQNGNFLALGLFDGQCVFYNVDIEKVRLRWHHAVKCHNGRRSAGRVTSILFFSKDIAVAGDNDIDKYNIGNNQCLVTTNDSRIRLFTLENYQINLKTKYKGHKNVKFWIGATSSWDGKFVICGSDDGAIYIWNKNVGNPRGKSGHLKMKNYESIRAPGRRRPTFVAIFAPKSSIGFLRHHRQFDDKAGSFLGMPQIDRVILSADSDGIIRIFVNYHRKPLAPPRLAEV